MSKISFYLTNPKTKNETPLFSLINYGLFSIEDGKKKYLPLKYYTNIVILPGLWNKDLNRAKESIKWADDKAFDISPQAVKDSAKKNYEAINSKIENFERTTKELLNSLTSAGQVPSHEQLRTELDRIFKPSRIVTEEGENPKELNSFIEFFIKTATRKQNTIKSYRTLQNNLLEYQKAKKITLNFEHINIDFYNSFVDYLKQPTTVKTNSGSTKVNPGLKENSIGTRIKILKTFMSAAQERGIEVPDDYTKKSFRKLNEETFSIYLTESDLNQIYSKSELPAYLERVRDMFLIGCYTGLRFSDLSKLKKENLTKDNTINILTQKTNQSVVVPIHPIVREIFAKYDYQLPRIPTNQKFNDYLKLVAEKAELNELVTIERSKGNLVVGQAIEKWKLVTSHTARRSFATNAFLADMPSISIMKITGHKTESAFMKYLKMTAKDNAIKMQSHPFFNKSITDK